MGVDQNLVTLAEAAIAGRADARERLLEELRPTVVRATRLVVGAGSSAAEDAAQEAMIDLYRGIEQLRGPQSVRAWALRIAMTRALKTAANEWRWWHRKRLTPYSVTATPETGDAALLKAAFDELPPRMRAVAVLRLHAGLSEAETAEALGCSVGTAKSQLSDARRRLSRALQREGLVPMTPRANDDRRNTT